jgi:hypothetical protein
MKFYRADWQASRREWLDYAMGRILDISICFELLILLDGDRSKQWEGFNAQCY